MVHFRLGKFEKSSFYQEKAVEIWEETLLKNHPDLINAKKFLEIIRVEINKIFYRCVYFNPKSKGVENVKKRNFTNW